MTRYQISNRLKISAAGERQGLIDGLLAGEARIPPRYFYDELGSVLYTVICQLPEYYLTRTEATIFAGHRDAIAEAVGSGKQLVDLGAGDCRKAAQWFPVWKPDHYLAVDAAEAFLRRSLGQLADEFPSLGISGVVTDFAAGLDLDGELGERPVTFFYPGSSIGNFSPQQSLGFLRQIRAHCRDARSGLLLGVDAKKDAARLNAAYADSLGVTASFNLNVLNHVNRAIGADFALDKFRHVAFYNEAAGRVEMHLEATADCTVHIGEGVRRFAAGERIHTEDSYKYHPAEFAALLQQAGFTASQCWQDEARDFCVFYAC